MWFVCTPLLLPLSSACKLLLGNMQEEGTFHDTHFSKLNRVFPSSRSSDIYHRTASALYNLRYQRDCQLLSSFFEFFNFFFLLPFSFGRFEPGRNISGRSDVNVTKVLLRIHGLFTSVPFLPQPQKLKSPFSCLLCLCL